MSETRYREVTAEQLKAGYYVNTNPSWNICAGFVEPEHREYSVIRKTEQGTYIVVDPGV